MCQHNIKDKIEGEIENHDSENNIGYGSHSSTSDFQPSCSWTNVEVNEDSNMHSVYNFEVSRLKNNFDSIIQLCTDKDISTTNLIKKTNIQLEKVKTTTQLSSVLVQLGKRNLKKSIHVQPTAISRRKERSGLTRGSRRIQAS